jgi:penicillin amidase
MAYLDGINQYLDDGKTPIEFSLVGIKKKFTITDVYNILDTCLLVLRWRKKSDPLLTDIRNKYGMEYVKILE